MKTLIPVVCGLIAVSAVGTLRAQAPVTPEFVMANNDLDKDGIITKEEATKAGRQLAQAWDFFDANMDGKVDLEELKKALAATAGAAPPGAPPGK